jgi:hypothetical protein
MMMVTGLKEPTAGGLEQPGVGVKISFPWPKAGKVMEVNPQTGVVMAVEVGTKVVVGVAVGVVGGEPESGLSGYSLIQAQGAKLKTIKNELMRNFFKRLSPI